MLERLRALFKAPARQWAFQTSIFFKASKHKLPLLSSIRTGPKLYESTRSPCFLQAPYELVLLCFQLNRKFVNIIDHTDGSAPDLKVHPPLSERLTEMSSKHVRTCYKTAHFQEFLRAVSVIEIDQQLIPTIVRNTSQRGARKMYAR